MQKAWIWEKQPQSRSSAQRSPYTARWARACWNLKLSRIPLGLLINFNVALLKDGVRRMAFTAASSNR